MKLIAKYFQFHWYLSVQAKKMLLERHLLTSWKKNRNIEPSLCIIENPLTYLICRLYIISIAGAVGVTDIESGFFLVNVHLGGEPQFEAEDDENDKGLRQRKRSRKNKDAFCAALDLEQFVECEDWGMMWISDSLRLFSFDLIW